MSFRVVDCILIMRLLYEQGRYIVVVCLFLSVWVLFGCFVCRCDESLSMVFLGCIGGNA